MHPKQTGVPAYFNKRFVKSGHLGEAIGRTLNKAFELRQRGDYREHCELSKDQVEPWLGEAVPFLAAVGTYLDENAGRKELRGERSMH